MICEEATLLVSVRARLVYCEPTVASSFLLGSHPSLLGGPVFMCAGYGVTLHLTTERGLSE